MSVHGELARHLDALIDLLGAQDDTAASALRRALDEARPPSNGELSASARRILDELRQAGLPASTPEEFGPEVGDAASTVVAICRIVLGE